jgi:HK97 family phage prohead protease
VTYRFYPLRAWQYAREESDRTRRQVKTRPSLLVPTRVKARGTGRIEAIVAVFGNTDLQNERIVRGAFKNSLARWRASGDPVPVVWSHDWGDPFAHIGRCTNLRETDRGLHVIGRLDVDDNPTAAHVFRLLQDRRVKEFSFSYDVVDSRRTDDGVTELLDLDLIEVGPTLRGANPETELVSVR